MNFRKEDTVIDLASILDNTTDPTSYQYFLGLKNNELLISTEIGDDAIERYVMPLIRMDKDPTVPEITIYISTPGGDIFSGMAICDQLSRLSKKTKVIILAQACSMGGVIAMSGSNNPNVKTYCYPHSICLIHGGMLGLGGTRKVVKDTQKFLEKYEEKINQFMIENSKISTDLLKVKEDDEWYMTAEEMVEYGIVDEIL